jgi:2-methylcitrate dehydratase PrpD
MTGPCTPDQPISGALSQFLADSKWEDLPADVGHQAKRAVLNFFATALGGCRDAAIELALRTFADFSGPRMAAIIGRTERADPLTAAFLNAASANVFDFDDTHVPTIIHPTAPVAAALFALAARCRITGRMFLHAFVLGVETECRIGNSVSPTHYRRGWHITATCGVFGAAAAAGKILGLDQRRMLWALGNASAQSAGLVETLGSMAKSIGVGNSARNGLISALLAENGFVGPDRPIEGPRGFTKVMSEQRDLSRISEGLGASWELLCNTYKPYPCGVVLNPVIEACLNLHREHDLSSTGIRRIVVTGHPLLRERADRPCVTTGREAQVSAQHSVAIVLLQGAAGVLQYTDAAVHDPAVKELRAKVLVEDDAAFAVGAARVNIETTNGVVLTAQISEARGSLTRPMTDSELERKLASLVEYGCPGFRTDPLIDAIWSMDRCGDVRGIIDMTSVDVGRFASKSG